MHAVPIKQKLSLLINRDTIPAMCLFLIPLLGGYQLAVHLFFIGWITFCGRCSKQSLFFLFLGVASLASSFFYPPLSFGCSILGVILLMIGLIQTLLPSREIWLIVPLSYFFLRTSLDSISSVKITSMVLTLSIIGLIPSFSMYIKENKSFPFLELNSFPQLKRIQSKVKEKLLWLGDPFDACFLIVSSTTLIWVLCIGFPMSAKYGALPLKYKNTILLFNFLTLPFLVKPKGWIYFLGMAGMNYVLGVRTGGLALLAMGGNWIVMKRWPKHVLMLAGILLFLGAWWSIFGIDLSTKFSWIGFLGEKYRSFYERVIVWKKVSQIADKSFWFGVGPCYLFHALKTPLNYIYKGTPFSVTIVHPHNIFLEIRSCFGVVGLALFIGSVVEGMRRTLQSVAPLPLVLLWTSSGVYLLILWSGYLSFLKDPWIIAWGALVWKWSYSFFLLNHNIGKREMSF